jgi:hypothetical protein
MFFRRLFYPRMNVYMLVQAMAERHEPEITKHETASFSAMPRCSPCHIPHADASLRLVVRNTGKRHSPG